MKKALKLIILILLLICGYKSLIFISPFFDYRFEKKVLHNTFNESWTELEKNIEKNLDCSSVSGISFFDKTLNVPYFSMIENDIRCILSHIEKNDVDYFKIGTSYGGKAYLGLEFNEYLKNKNITPIIEKECSSACVTMIFGNDPIICSNAKIGIHQLRVDSKKVVGFFDLVMQKEKENLENAISIILTEHAKNAGINLDFHNEILNKTPYYDIYYLKNDEIIKHGYVKKIIDCK